MYLVCYLISYDFRQVKKGENHLSNRFVWFILHFMAYYISGLMTCCHKWDVAACYKFKYPAILVITSHCIMEKTDFCWIIMDVLWSDNYSTMIKKKVQMLRLVSKLP